MRLVAPSAGAAFSKKEMGPALTEAGAPSKKARRATALLARIPTRPLPPAPLAWCNRRATTLHLLIVTLMVSLLRGHGLSVLVASVMFWIASSWLGRVRSNCNWQGDQQARTAKRKLASHAIFCSLLPLLLISSCEATSPPPPSPPPPPIPPVAGLVALPRVAATISAPYGGNCQASSCIDGDHTTSASCGPSSSSGSLCAFARLLGFEHG